MKLKLKKDRFLIFFFIFLGVLLFSLLACLFLLRHIETLQNKSSNDRYISYLLATKMRQSSDDLTKMVRLYVTTREKKYRDFYNEIIAIRDGKSPRPLNYHQIYWDLVIDSKRPRPFGKPEALLQTMIDHGFTLQEYNLLSESKARSDQLIKMEVQAMNAIEGKFDDGSGKYVIAAPPNRELANSLVFGREYMEQKASVMEPLQRFFESVEQRTHQRDKTLNSDMFLVIVAAILLAAGSTLIMLISIFKALKSLSIATRESELLLLNILPEQIAIRLKAGEEPIADEFPQASVLFTDIVGFTQMTSQYGPTKMIDILNSLFDQFDRLSEKYGVEKVKTIGDSYMAVAGVPIPATDHAMRIANFALAIQEKLQDFNRTNQLNLEMRTGMTFGNVVAGVIGRKKFIYDVWGDVVNTASRMESTCPVGEIQITEKMALMLEDNFIVEPHAEVDIKGKGMMKTYFLKGKKHSDSDILASPLRP